MIFSNFPLGNLRIKAAEYPHEKFLDDPWDNKIRK